MQLSRRQIFHISWLTMGSFALGMLPGNRSSFKAEASTLIADNSGSSKLKATTFHPLKKDVFHIKTPDGQLRPVTLSNVSEHTSCSRTEGFSLDFRDRNHQPLEQGTYCISHPKLGNLDCFMVPTQPEATGQNYVVTINHLIA